MQDFDEGFEWDVEVCCLVARLLDTVFVVRGARVPYDGCFNSRKRVFRLCVVTVAQSLEVPADDHGGVPGASAGDR